MERDKRNQSSSFLMVVGIIFIVAAGTIFVSKAWRYLPDGGKQCILLLASLGLFAGSSKMRKKGGMQKTEAALYYLGVSFLGLSALSICSSILKTLGQDRFFGWNAEAVMAASLAMLLPTAARFRSRRSAFDFTLTALLADCVVFWFGVSMHSGVFASCMLSAVGLFAYTLADCMREKWQEGKSHVEQAFSVLYIIHWAAFGVHNMMLVMIEDAVLLKTGLFLMALSAAGLTALIRVTRKQKVFRVFNSVAVYWCIITGTVLLNEVIFALTGKSWDGQMAAFLAFTFCAVCMVLFAREEMVLISVVWGMLVPFVQIYSFGDYYKMFYFVEHHVSACLPFSGVLAAAGTALILQRVRSGDISRERARQYACAAGVQAVVWLVMFYASRNPFFVKGMWSILTLQCIGTAFLLENRTGKKVFRTLALAAGEILAVISLFDFDEVLADYYMECICFLAAAGIFLLGVIWENHGSAMRTFQFICVCVLFSLLLANAVLFDAVGHALILGITGVAILIPAAIFNSRRYVVLASIVLILLVFYITRSFWFSIAWWVYLFVAGIILVLIAVKKEQESSGNEAE